MSAFTKTFWADAAERSLKTAAQSAITAMGAGAIDLLSVPWESVIGLAAGGAVLSILTSIVSAGAAANGTASLVPEIVAAPALDTAASDPDATIR